MGVGGHRSRLSCKDWKDVGFSLNETEAPEGFELRSEGRYLAAKLKLDPREVREGAGRQVGVWGGVRERCLERHPSLNQPVAGRGEGWARCPPLASEPTLQQPSEPSKR